MASSPPEMLPGDGLKSFTWKNNPCPPYKVKDFGQECKPKIPDLCLYEKAVLSYNEEYAREKWDVDILSAALQQRPDFKPLLKKIADLALKLPDLVTQPIPLMKQNEESSISLSQMQIACLLANAFYCTFPGRSGTNSRHQQPNFPAINFNTLFCAFFPRGTEVPDDTEIERVDRQFRYKVEKIICILHYFSRVLGEEGPPTGAVTFSRRCLNNLPDFESSDVRIGSVPFGTSSTCRIEDAGGDTMQVDFADPYIGGEFLRFGCVQEEIMCGMQPEILVGRLFLERLLPHEAALVIGAERFSNYTALIQLMACAQAGKSLAYCTFGDESFEKELQQVHDSLVASDCTVELALI
ncbi:hypothetical protein SprV_0301317800 [Sparganum proliferum]